MQDEVKPTTVFGTPHQRLLGEKEALIGRRTFPNITAHSGLKLLRRILKMLSVQTAEAYTWKRVRAGKATAMASNNVSLADICQAGEWKDQSVPGKHYVNEDMADEETMLRQMVLSDDED